MNREEYDHIRADVQNALVESAQHDPTVAPEILFRLLDTIGEVAVDVYGSSTVGDVYPAMRVVNWAERVLRDVQFRAVSKVPYGELPGEIEPEDHR